MYDVGKGEKLCKNSPFGLHSFRQWIDFMSHYICAVIKVLLLQYYFSQCDCQQAVRYIFSYHRPLILPLSQLIAYIAYTQMTYHPRKFLWFWNWNFACCENLNKYLWLNRRKLWRNDFAFWVWMAFCSSLIFRCCSAADVRNENHRNWIILVLLLLVYFYQRSHSCK